MTAGPQLHSCALVLAGGINGLGVVRSLQQRGVRSIVAYRSSLDHASFSRIPLERHQIPSSASLVEWVADFVDSHACVADCVIPTSDEFAAALRLVAARQGARVPAALAPGELVDLLNDKVLEHALVSSAGIVTPATATSLCALGAGTVSLPLPLIIKPRSYRTAPLLGRKNLIVSQPMALHRFLKAHEEHLDAFLAQEIIPGDESHLWVCNATFDRDSQMLSAFTFQRLGTVPYLYGVTTFAVSAHNPEVKRLCSLLGRTLGYVGPAMFEFKLDPRSGQYVYIETNPRLGMCNWFDTKCGVNNAFNAYAVATGAEPVRNIDRQVDGRRFLNLSMDLYARWQAGRPLLEIARHYARYLSTDVVRPVWYWRDPLPVLAHPAQVIRKGLRPRSRPHS